MDIGGEDAMTIEREIELLKEKVVLLEKIKELQENIAKSEIARQPVYVPYPVYPPLYPCNPAWPIVTYTATSMAGEQRKG